MSRLTIALLGPFEVRLDEDLLTDFESDKGRALLAFLATESDQPRTRDFLAGWLWPELSQKAARNNLRQSLFKLRQIIGDREASPSFLLTTRKEIQFNLDSDHWLDVAQFEAAWSASQQHHHRSLDTCPVCIHRLERAVALYRGDFLEGFYLPDSEAFEEWMLFKREALHVQVLEALAHLAAYYERRAEYEPARRYAQRQIELEPWREAAHRRLMRLLALDGQRNAALAQYEACRQLLADELGVEPADETTALYERIQSGDLSGRAVAPLPLRPSAPLHNLPVQLTPFIGREAELIQLSQRLANPDYRLLTLVGSGGVGKTRLALAAAEQQVGLFRDGVWFVPLAGIEATDTLVTAIADAVGAPLSGREEPRAQLLGYLREKEMLLVLDNFEHLLAGADLVVDVLRRAPGVMVLVTSRERLNVQAEYVFGVGGMAFPENRDVGAAGGYSAVRLFTERADRARPAGFTLAAEYIPDVVQVCRLVEGLPLAIELAAAWLDQMPLDEIGRSIQRNLGFLATSMRDVPARHRSVRAVYEHSWQLLTPQQQLVLAQLSVFRGDFSREAALAVTDATPAEMEALAGKSLLREGAGERFEMHELLRQYSADKLAQMAEESEETQERHCDYYATFLQQRRDQLEGVQSKRVLDDIGAEMDNVRAAWNRALLQGRQEQIEKAVESLDRFYDLRNWFREGQDTFGRAAAVLRAQDEEEMKSILASILARHGHFYQRLGRLEEAREQFQQSLSLWRQAGKRHGMPYTLDRLAQVVHDLGDNEKARALLEEAVTIAQEVDDQRGAAQALLTLGIVASETGKYPEAKRHYQESLSIQRALNDDRGTAFCLNNLGVVMKNLGEYDEARELFDESRSLCEALDDEWGMTFPLSNLADVAWTLGDRQAARAYYDETLAIRTEVHAETHLLANLAEIARHLDAEGAKERALELATFVLHHPATTRFFKERMRERYAKLVSELSSEEVKRIERGAHSQTLEQVVVTTQRWLRGEV